MHQRGEVAVVTLDHQPDRNALSWAMTRALSGAVAAIQAEGRAGALVVASAGPVFCAGGSVDDLLEPKAPLEAMYAGFEAIAESALPSVAAVNGPALGAGMNVALACDLIICTPSARFETRFLDVGLHPGGGHLWQLRQRGGRGSGPSRTGMAMRRGRPCARGGGDAGRSSRRAGPSLSGSDPGHPRRRRRSAPHARRARS